MKRILLLLLMVISLDAYTQEQTQDLIQNKDTGRIQLIFEIVKANNADANMWNLIKKTMLQLYIPELQSEEAVDAWLQAFAKVVKSIAHISQKTHDAHGNITIRFIID